MLEMITLAPLVSLALGLTGVVVGLLVGHFVLPAARRGRRLQTALDALHREHEDYRRQVTEHFDKTAVLVGDLTASYKAVYDHLASGARQLRHPALAGPAFKTPRLIVDGSAEPAGAGLPREPFAREDVPASRVVPAAPRPAPEPPAGASVPAQPPSSRPAFAGGTPAVPPLAAASVGPPAVAPAGPRPADPSPPLDVPARDATRADPAPPMEGAGGRRDA
jgi:uncharacterized protein